MSFLNKMVRQISRFRYLGQISTTISAPVKVPRNFSSNPVLHHKMFKELENKYAYDIMKSKGFALDIETIKDSESLTKEQFQSIIDQDWTIRSPEQIFEVFPKLGKYCAENTLCISNKVFDNYIDNLTDSIERATDSELVSLFYDLNLWPETQSVRTRNFIEVWVALDDACHNRLNDWSPDKMLSFISLFYMLNVTKHSSSSRKMLDKLANKAKKLTPEQLVRTLFFVGVQRLAPFNMHNLEVHLENIFTEFTVDDLAIMSMGFFKSKTPIRSNRLVMNIMEKVIDNSKTIHEVSLAALLKITRYSMRVPFEEGMALVNKLLDTLQYEVTRLSLMCNVHIALLGTTKLVLHEGCLDAIAKSVIDNLSKTRLKDLERLVLSYGTFRYTPQMKKNLCDAIIEELRNPNREEEIKTHRRSFACCVQYFNLMGVYPIDLINKALDSTFLERTYGKQCYMYGREILSINNVAQISCSEHKMNLLSERETKILSKKYTDYVPTQAFKKQYNVTEKMFIDVTKVLQEMRGGEQFVVGDHILTHHQRGDLILCNNSDGKPMPVEDKFPSNTFGLIRRPPDDNTWIVLVIAGRNSIIHGKKNPTGPFLVKIEELRKLGYHANLVLWHDYSTLDTVGEKAEYLGRCINDAIENK